MKRIVLLFSFFASLNIVAQDRIITEAGDTIKAVVASRDRKTVKYVGYDDPEFDVSSMTTDRISRIIFDNGKIIDFHKSKYPGAFLGMMLGTGMPISDFAHSEYGDERSGFAEGGKIALAIEGRYPIYKFIGLSGGLSIGTFGVDQATYFKEYNDQVFRSGSKNQITGTLSEYENVSFSIGPDIGLKLGGKLRFFIPVEIAYTSIKNKSEDDIKILNEFGNVVSETKRQTKGKGVGFSTGLRLEYMVSPHVGIGLEAKAYDYNVENTVTEVDGTSNVSIDYKWRQNVTYVHFGLSGRYHF